MAAFLDASKAYDKVMRPKLWTILEAMKLPVGILHLLQMLYEDNSVVLSYDGKTSEKVSTPLGLRQGCPLSPILFILYIAELETKLEAEKSRYRNTAPK